MSEAAEYPIETDIATVDAMLKAGEDFLLLDVREPDEVSIAHIEGSTLLPMSELVDRMAELNEHRDRQIVVHCHLGGRSLQVAHHLRNHGFAKAQSMAGGIDGWSLQVDASIPRY